MFLLSEGFFQLIGSPMQDTSCIISMSRRSAHLVNDEFMVYMRFIAMFFLGVCGRH